jgi:hypothetical protein
MWGGDAAAVTRWREQLTTAGLEGAHLEALTDGQRIDLLRALEELSCAAAGVQAVVAAGFDASQRARQAAAGVPVERQGRGVGAQVGLARRCSPYLGSRLVGLATVLTGEMPHTLAALVGGRITQWRATVIVRETACLSVEDRAIVDELIAGSPDRVAELEGWGERRLVGELSRHAQRLDVEAVLERRRRAVGERRVTGRPAPDQMMYLTALLPAAEGVSVLAALRQEARVVNLAGDPRSQGQIMADTLVARVTGRDPVTRPLPVTVNVVLPASALTGQTEESGYLDGYGPVPAEQVREWLTDLRGDDYHASRHLLWRRIYARPETGALVAMESRARLFPLSLARLIQLRDQTCRTPWCEAPVREIDHVIPYAEGGPTTVGNGQGLCTACNHAKQAPGWHAEPAAGDGWPHTVTTTTPTGHTYTSTAPPLAV